MKNPDEENVPTLGLGTTTDDLTARRHHDAYPHPMHLAYGNRYDPHAAVCRCGYIGRPRMNRMLAQADADEHNKAAT